MAIRVLLTPLFHSNDDRRALDTAFVLPERLQCHVDSPIVNHPKLLILLAH
jgi:hypothetical protein